MCIYMSKAKASSLCTGAKGGYISVHKKRHMACVSGVQSYLVPKGHSN